MDSINNYTKILKNDIPADVFVILNHFCNQIISPPMTQKKAGIKKTPTLWVKKGARTLDPRNHNPML